MRALIIDGFQNDSCGHFFVLAAMRPGLKVTVDTRLSRSINMYKSFDFVSNKMKLAKVSVV